MFCRRGDATGRHSRGDTLLWKRLPIYRNSNHNPRRSHSHTGGCEREQEVFRVRSNTLFTRWLKFRSFTTPTTRRPSAPRAIIERHGERYHGHSVMCHYQELLWNQLDTGSNRRSRSIDFFSVLTPVSNLETDCGGRFGGTTWFHFYPATEPTR